MVGQIQISARPTILTLLLLQIAVMLAAGLALGSLAARVRLPRLVGELAAGIIIGPTVLGHLLPNAEHSLFPHVSGLDTQRGAIVQFGLVLFLFSVGSHIDIPKLRRLGGRIVWTSFGGIAVPFALGYAGVFVFPTLWNTPDRHRLAFVVAVILSISALPVVAKILRDLGQLTSGIGTVIMAAATLDDLAGWSLFAVVSAGGGSGTHRPLINIVAVAVLVMFTLTIGRRVVQAIGETRSTVALRVLAAAAVAAFTEWLGLGAVFGAFLAGIAFANVEDANRCESDIVDRIANDVFAPLYFVSVGLQTDFGHSFILVLVIYMIAVASVGKVIGATMGARLGGAEPRTAWAIGFGLNARGAMAIVLASTALQRGLVTQPVFVAVVIMSIVTSLISGPAMQRFAGTSEKATAAT